MFRPAITAITLAALLSAQDRPRPYPIRPPSAYQQAVTAGTRSADGRPGPAYWRHDLRYRVRAALDPATARVTGHAELTFANRASRGIGNLVVHLRQNLHREDAVRNTRVAITGGMEIDALQLDGSPAQHWHVDGTLLHVDLPADLAPSAATTLALDFAFTVPPAGSAPRMGHEDHHVFFLGYWYPQFAVHDDIHGWAAEQYLGASEFYMPYGDYDVEFTAPVGWLVQATGSLQNPEAVLGNAARAALARAAADHSVTHVVDKEALDAGTATATSPSGTLAWHFTAENVRDCAVGVSDQWLWDSTHAIVRRAGAGASPAAAGEREPPASAGEGPAGAAEGSAGAGERSPGAAQPFAVEPAARATAVAPAAPGDTVCMIHAFYRPKAKAWRRAAQYAQHTIEFVSTRLTPYPWPHMSAFEGVIGGGMEYPMMTLIGDVSMPYMQQMVIAHELIHMWFPMQVGSNETAHAWQDEGLTDFVTDFTSSSYWRRKSTGYGSIAEYTAMARMGADQEPLMQHGDRYGPGFAYGFASYTKPKAMLHQLVGMFGQDAVFAALRDYALAWDRRHPTPWDFFACMNRSLGENLDWYWRTWCYENWRLDVEVAEVRTDGSETVVVIQDLGDAPQPTRVRATFGDGRTEERTVPVKHWLDGHRRAEMRFGSDVVEVAIDPARMTLDVDPSNNVWRR